MDSVTLLEGLYLGSLNENIIKGFESPEKFDRAQSIMEKYRELLKEHPSRDIEREGVIPKEMLQKMGQIGLFGLSIPKSYGGLGFDLWEYLKTVEEMVKLDLSLAMVSIAHLSIGSKGVVLYGSEAQKQKYLVPAASGDMIFCYALTEPLIGSDAQNIQTRAELAPDGSHYVLNGQKTYITNANYAGCMTVFAQMDSLRPGFMGAFIVETSLDGVKIGKDMPKMGLKASSTAAIQFKDVRVPVENLLGQPGEGFKIAMNILNYGRLGLGAASVAMMNRSLEDMVKRSATRVQFGEPIRNFPLVQEKIVKAKVYCYVAASMNNLATGIFQKDPTANAVLESSHCKLFGTTRAWDILYEALQVAGGSGYIATQPYEKRMRDFRVATVFEGTTEIHSIYPAIFLLRKIVKDMRALNGDRFSGAKHLIARIFEKAEWTLNFPDRELQRASRFCRTNSKTIRRMLYLGMLLYGKDIFKRELFLRRITVLSLYTYGVLALLANISALRRNGADEEEAVSILGYFLEEAKEARRANSHLLDSRKERLHKRIVDSLFPSSTHGPERRDPGPALSGQ